MRVSLKSSGLRSVGFTSTCDHTSVAVIGCPSQNPLPACLFNDLAFGDLVASMRKPAFLPTSVTHCAVNCAVKTPSLTLKLSAAALRGQ